MLSATPALDREVVQPALDRALRAPVGGSRAAAAALRTRTSASGSGRHAVRLGDRAVGDRAVVGVQAEGQRRGRARSASRQPRLASSTAYGRVTLVSA